jgi:hypothetical protein
MIKIPVKQETGAWDFDESKDFVEVTSSIDNLTYKIYEPNTPVELQLKLANILARVRKDLNKMLLFAVNNPGIWRNHPIAWGMFHTFDLHISPWKSGISNLDLINQECIRSGTLFNYQEMPKNDNGILGLNKPKNIFATPVKVNGKEFNYEIADHRSIFLTLRDFRTNKIHKYSVILELALHELTHTTANDCRWKEDNHLPPYNSYRKIINKLARKNNLIN